MFRRFIQSLAWFVAMFVVTGVVFAAPDRHVVLITIDGLAAYMMVDGQASLPSLRRLAMEGVMAEGMTVSSPAVTWPNHTTLVTGVQPRMHSVLFNGVLVPGEPGLPVRIDPKRDKAELVAMPTLYDLLHGSGFRTAGINWPCTRNSGTLDDDFPDVPDQITNSTARLRGELVASGVLKDETDKSFSAVSAAAKDQIWTAAAVHVIRTKKPHFLLLHMLVTDSIQHKYGPQSPAAYTAAALADAQLGQVLEALGEAGIREKSTVIVTADHGFATALKVLNPNVLLRKAGFVELGSTNQIVRARAQAISEGGSAFIYFTNPQSIDADLEKVGSLMRGQEGIDEILGADQFPNLGLPDPAKNRQMAELILVAKDGYAFSNTAAGDEYLTPVTLASGNQGYHGYLAGNTKMNAIFVAAGRGIRRGGKLGLIRNTDVAPTIGRLLGQELPKSEGRVLTEILTD